MVAAVHRSERSALRWKKAELGGALATHGRSHRLAARLQGEKPPRFADIFVIPEWALTSHNPEQLALATGVLYFRKAIDQEISGHRLAILAEMLGDHLFDQLCDAELPLGAATDGLFSLPSPDEIRRKGEALLAASRPGPQRDSSAALLADYAAKILSGQPE